MQWKRWAVISFPLWGLCGCGDSGSSGGQGDAGELQDGSAMDGSDGATPGGDGDVQGDGDGDGDQPLDPCGGCSSDLCLPDKTCAECMQDAHCTGDAKRCDVDAHVCVPCLADADCSGAAPRCDASTHACVACLPGADDNCPQGQYCDDVELTCKTGCNRFRCASGVCEPDGDCSLCVSDNECAEERICSTRECVAVCGDSGEICPDSYTCCDGRCAVLDRDPDNCMACDNACEAAEFCGESGCTGNTVGHVCDALKISFLLDGLTTDDARAQDIYTAFGNECVQDPPRQKLAQTDSDALNQETGQPVVGAGELVVVLGGPFGQHIVGYLEDNKLTQSYNKFDGTTAWFYGRGVDGEPDPAIVTAPYSTLNEHHDFFVIETVTDPISRARVLKLYGLDYPGTNAAAWFFANVVLTDPASFGGTHYIYEWTDATTDGPSEDDAFSEVVAE